MLSAIYCLICTTSCIISTYFINMIFHFFLTECEAASLEHERDVMCKLQEMNVSLTDYLVRQNGVPITHEYRITKFADKYQNDINKVNGSPTTGKFKTFLWIPGILAKLKISHLGSKLRKHAVNYQIFVQLKIFGRNKESYYMSGIVYSENNKKAVEWHSGLLFWT